MATFFIVISTLYLGFDTWGVEFSSQLNTLNTMGPQLMKDNLNAMFVPAGSNTLESYFEEVSRKADVAYKKSFVSNVTPFQGIAKVRQGSKKYLSKKISRYLKVTQAA